ncbi:MAG: ABC-type transporter, integral rane subunit [Haloplasmataceae bacterium]|nr:ABC-type transporter, integral rane subunit [Haloplasmataceae bacterium]
MSKRRELYENANINDLFVAAELRNSESEHLAVEPYSYWASVFKEFKKKPSAIVSVVLLVIIILLSIFVPMFSKYDIVEPNTLLRNIRPNFKYLFGTDRNGYDLFTVVWTGARTSLSIAFIVSIINSIIGIIMGTIWGYFKKLDLVMLEIYNFVTNIPSMLYYMILVYVLDSLEISSVLSLIIAMTLTGWIGLARLIRNQILIITNREYNVASRTLGTPPSRVIIFNLLPYILTVIITSISLTIPSVIGTEVSLAYFGLGLSMETLSLGRILRDAYNSWMADPHILIFPALVVGLITIIFYLIGLALADALDPKTHR